MINSYGKYPDRNFAGVTPEWSDTEEPAVKVTGSTLVIKLQVLGLSFLAAT